MLSVFPRGVLDGILNLLESVSEGFPYYSYLWDRMCSIFNGTGKFCLAHELRQLTRHVKSDVRKLNFKSDVTYALPRKAPNDVRRGSLCDVKCQKLKK